MRLTGLVFLFAGFLAGAYFATREIDAVDWHSFAPAAGAMLVGLALVRVDAARSRGEGERHDLHVETLSDAIGAIVAKLGAMNAARATIGVYDVHGRLDAELVADLDRFVQSRESLIPRYGLQRYADVMSAFAGGERNVNRAWSASADGYVDEVWACLDRAERLMTDARDQLARLRAE